MNLSAFFSRACQDVMKAGADKTSKLGLRIKNFRIGSEIYHAIEQNPFKDSTWAQLAREGHQVIQVLDSNGKYIGVSVDGKFQLYSNKGI